MLPLLLLLLLHHGSGNERAENRTEGERKKKWIKRKKKGGRGWGPNNFPTKPPALSPEICWQTMKEVSRSQRGWGPAKKPGGGRAKGEDRWEEGGREGERKKHRDGGLIHCSRLHCHQEFISSWKGVKEGWKGQRDGGWTLCPSLPATDDQLPVYLPVPPLRHHPSCRLSSRTLHISSAPLPSGPAGFTFPVVSFLPFSSSLHPSLQLSRLLITFQPLFFPFVLLFASLTIQTLPLWSQNSDEQPFSRHEK